MSDRNNPPRPCAQRGVALVITLGILVVIAIAIIGVMSTVRVERAAAESHLSKFRAETMADAGVEEVIASLAEYTSDQNVNWTSQPGRLFVSAPGSLSLDPDNPVHLFSTPDGSTPASGARINIPLFIKTPDGEIEYTLTPHDPTDPASAPPPMFVRWQYVRQDGTLTYDEPPAYSAGNPVVGRFAYWTDDESAKVNINIASSRGVAGGDNYDSSDRGPSHLSNVDLSALGFQEQEIRDLVNAREGTPTSAPFDTPAGARRVPGATRQTDFNKFNLTHFSHEPETTFFNEPRIVLTTQESHAPRDQNGNLLRDSAGRPYFLDILKTPDSDPGVRDTISDAKLNSTLALLLNYLKRSDWPMVEGNASLQDKYFEGKEQRLGQLAINILEYVRSAESAATFVEPLIVFQLADGSFVNSIGTSTIEGVDGAFIGITRSPLITELGQTRDRNETVAIAGKTYFRVRFQTEIHLPEHFGIDQVNLLEPSSGFNLYINIAAVQRESFPASSPINKDVQPPRQPYFRKVPPTNQRDLPTAVTDTYPRFAHRVFDSDIRDQSGNQADPVMKAGEYRVIEKDFWIEKTPANEAAWEAGNFLYHRAALILSPTSTASINADNNLPRIAVAPLGAPFKAFVPGLGISANDQRPQLLQVRLGADGMALSSSTTAQSDDPRINGIPGDWRLGLPPTLGTSNAGKTLGALPAPPRIPIQDTDTAGRLSDASLRMPFPKGHPRNPDGLVYSIGELGFISTGYESLSTQAAGVPWRTIRLQPTQGQDNTVVPDWAFMDLFTVPVLALSQRPRLSQFYAPHGNSVGGRVNVNAKPHPFPMSRPGPLAATMVGAAYDTTNPTKKLTFAEAVTLAGNIAERTLSDKGGTTYGLAEAFDSPGEIIEISGVADRGEAGEELVRQVAPLLTSRGGVFSVYSTGQALKQRPDSSVLVTGEQRVHAMIERLLTTQTDPATGATSNRIEFRQIYYRNLTP